MSRQVGGYVVTRKLGQGAFAVVYHARHPTTGQEVAIKAIQRERLTARRLEYLESEISILKHFQHPNIVKLYDIRKTEKHIYLILEYCGGGDLHHFIRKHRRLPEHTARHFMRDLARGLHFLSSQNLIHRDLKPQNLLLTEESATATLKIADFGFARHLAAAALAETLCGSPLYMAPEILQFQKYDAKADLWSVGTILFEMLVGRPPFGGANQAQLVANIKRNEVRVPDDVPLSPPCVALLQGLLRRNPLKRMAFDRFFRHEFLGLEAQAVPATPGASLLAGAALQDVPEEMGESKESLLSVSGEGAVAGAAGATAAAAAAPAPAPATPAPPAPAPAPAPASAPAPGGRRRSTGWLPPSPAIVAPPHSPERPNPAKAGLNSPSSLRTNPFKAPALGASDGGLGTPSPQAGDAGSDEFVLVDAPAPAPSAYRPPPRAVAPRRPTTPTATVAATVAAATATAAEELTVVTGISKGAYAVSQLAEARAREAALATGGDAARDTLLAEALALFLAALRAYKLAISSAQRVARDPGASQQQLADARAMLAWLVEQLSICVERADFCRTSVSAGSAAARPAAALLYEAALQLGRDAEVKGAVLGQSSEARELYVQALLLLETVGLDPSLPEGARGRVQACVEGFQARVGTVSGA